VAQTAFIALVHDQPGSQELPAGVVAREGREGGRKGGREGDLAQTAFIALVNDQPGSQELSAGVVARGGREGGREGGRVCVCGTDSVHCTRKRPAWIPRAVRGGCS